MKCGFESARDNSQQQRKAEKGGRELNGKKEERVEGFMSRGPIVAAWVTRNMKSKDQNQKTVGDTSEGRKRR